MNPNQLKPQVIKSSWFQINIFELVQALGSGYCASYLDVSIRALRKWQRGECEPRSRWQREAIYEKLKEEHRRVIELGGGKYEIPPKV
jgi:hypothetical protein